MSNYHLIKPTSISDGIGVRVAIYLSGCNWHCKGCHNPETWDPKSGKPFTNETLEELYNYLNHAYIAGITLTGGDPLNDCNLDIVNKIIEMVHERSSTFEGGRKDIWMYTGYKWEDIEKDSKLAYIAGLVDILVDGQFIQELRDISYPFAGSTNQRVIDVAEYISYLNHYYKKPEKLPLFDSEKYYLRK